MGSLLRRCHEAWYGAVGFFTYGTAVPGRRDVAAARGENGDLDSSEGFCCAYDGIMTLWCLFILVVLDMPLQVANKYGEGGPIRKKNCSISDLPKEGPLED